jgi:hypothetical protein
MLERSLENELLAESSDMNCLEKFLEEKYRSSMEECAAIVSQIEDIEKKIVLKKDESVRTQVIKIVF